MNLPKVTVLIANHNYEHFLADCLESVKNQTYFNLHVCIVDDCSDNPNEVAKVVEKALGLPSSQELNKYGIKNYNGKYTLILLEKNVGPSEARNIGIEATINDTDFYLILDADDVLYPTKIDKLVETALLDPNVAVVYADYDILNVDTGTIRREFKEPFDKMRLNQECIVHSGSLISKESLKAVKDEFGYYDREMRTCEDYDLWMRISERFMIMHVAEPLTLVRVHQNNSTYTVNKEIWNRNWQRIVDKIKHRHAKQ